MGAGDAYNIFIGFLAGGTLQEPGKDQDNNMHPRLYLGAADKWCILAVGGGGGCHFSVSED